MGQIKDQPKLVVNINQAKVEVNYKIMLVLIISVNSIPWLCIKLSSIILQCHWFSPGFFCCRQQWCQHQLSLIWELGNNKPSIVDTGSLPLSSPQNGIFRKQLQYVAKNSNCLTEHEQNGWKLCAWLPPAISQWVILFLHSLRLSQSD